MGETYKEFLDRTKKIHLLVSINELIAWDKDVYMPSGEFNKRSMETEVLSSLVHDELTCKDYVSLIKKLGKKKLNSNEKCNFLEMRRLQSRALKVSNSLVKEIDKATSQGYQDWLNARSKNDFKLFEKSLSKLIDLKIKYANQINNKKNPYEVLFEDFEEYVPFKFCKKLLLGTYEEVGPLIKSANSSSVLKEKRVDEKKQESFNLRVLKKLNYDFRKGRFDVSVHPFTCNPGFGRITTRYTDGWINSLLSTVHECGHALYEQGLPFEHFATPRGSSGSLSIHESQSRIWENHVARSKEFWDYFYKDVSKEYGLKDSKEEFLKKLNTSRKGFIRVNADELTYIAHDIIRMIIEEELINKKIKVKDANKRWNDLMFEYLGIKPRSDNEGILQDIHWAYGNFGYFPTYVLGSIIAAQLFHFADKELNLKSSFKKGDFSYLLSWLRKKVHEKGRLYDTLSLVKNATGEELSNKYYVAHLKERYGKIEVLKNA